MSAGTYIVAVKDAKGCTAVAKSPVKINNSTKVCTTAFIFSDDENLDVQVYPNPTKNTFTLSLHGDESSLIEIKLTDMYGKELYHSAELINRTYNLGANLAAGVYFLQVIHHNQIKTFKIIKQ